MLVKKLARNSPLGSVDKALRALECLGETGVGGLSLNRLAHELSLNKASLHRTLSALRHRGFVEQDSHSNYRLGPAIFALADSYIKEEDLHRTFHEGLSELCRRINETCHLGVLVGEQVVYIDKVEPRRDMRFWSEIGWRGSALCTALGRAILSQQFVDYESFASKFTAPTTPQTRITLRSVWQELLDARKRGYAKEEQENDADITCIAVALLRGVDAIAAISITTPLDRMDERRALAVVQSLRECISPRLPLGMSLQKPMLNFLDRATELQAARDLKRGFSSTSTRRRITV